MSPERGDGESAQPAFTAADVALLEEALAHEAEWIRYKFVVDEVMTTGVRMRLLDLAARMRRYVREHPGG